MYSTKNTYRKSCSCCGHTVSNKMLKLPDNNDSEGNLCHNCYYEQIRDNFYQIAEMIEMVYNSLKSPLAKFKFKYKPFHEQRIIIFRLIDKGYLKWKIG